jgi:hypothetical protein
MSQRMAKTKTASGTAQQQMKPQTKPICTISRQLEQSVAQWGANSNREASIVAALQALTTEIISLGNQDTSMLFDQHAVRTARHRVAATSSDTYRAEDVDRAASIFSSNIMSTLTRAS